METERDSVSRCGAAQRAGSADCVYCVMYHCVILGGGSGTKLIARELVVYEYSTCPARPSAVEADAYEVRLKGSRTPA